MNILITAANSSAAYQLKNKLKGETIILGDYLELPAVMLKTGQMIQLPNPASISYTHEMLTLCLDKNINVIYPLREEELLLLNGAKQLFAEFNMEIAVNRNF